MSFETLCKSLEDTEHLAEKFADIIKNDGAFVCMFGETGAGKTAFTKYICKYLNVKEKVTSPSFVILNEYKTGIIPVYHFDLYRLENSGINSIIDQLDEYSEGKILTVVEWPEFSQDNLPYDRTEIAIIRNDDESRKFVFSATGNKSSEILKGLKL